MLPEDGFRIGDIVKCKHRGMGVVTNTQAQIIWPIEVTFNRGGGKFTYTRSGYLFDEGSALREKEPELAFIERPPPEEESK
jgi:hypothetical protein